MAFLTTAEVKTLEKAPKTAILVYVFSAKLREKNGVVEYPGNNSEGIDTIISDTAGLVNDADGKTVNAQAVKERLAAMIDRRIITPSDRRKILKLLGIHN